MPTKRIMQQPNKTVAPDDREHDSANSQDCVANSRMERKRVFTRHVSEKPLRGRKALVLGHLKVRHVSDADPSRAQPQIDCQRSDSLGSKWFT